MLILCMKIFITRIIDMSLGTYRTILIVKNRRFAAAVIGFIECSIWFTIARQAINYADNNIWVVISYAGGFAAGTYIGGWLSERFITGTMRIQVITDNKNNLIENLRQMGYGVSVVDVKGKDNSNKCMLLIEINKRYFNDLKNKIKQYDNHAFVVANETNFIQNGFIKK